MTSRSPWPNCHDRDGPPPSGGAGTAGRAGADDGDHRVLEVEALAVAVPGDRVAAVAVEVEADRVERSVVALGERDGASCEHRQRLGLGAGVAPPSGEPRLGQHAGRTSRRLAGATAGERDEFGEHQVGAAQPARHVIDPRLVVEPRAGEAVERQVDRRLFEREQALLPDERGVVCWPMSVDGR